jgi:hypothetical protein
MRSLIIEGMDGSGKDTLIKDLSRLFPRMPLHARASTSIGGPVDSLAQWVEEDTARMLKGSTPHIYNRHPLVSERIYAPIRKNDKPIAEKFNDDAWHEAYRRIVGSCSVLIICQPPFKVVAQTIKEQGADAHMPGVYQATSHLYQSYAMLVWPGRTIRYDYTKNKPRELAEILKLMMEN